MSSPAQPIVNWRNKLIDWAEKAAKLPSGKQDTAWHNEMVRKATESFTKPKQAQTKVVSSSKATPAKKQAPAKKATRKRVSSK